MAESPIRLLLADVDGTLVTSEKLLTQRAVQAVRDLRRAGVLFAITSGRPPRGMAMLVKPLQLTTPVAAFNGGMLVDREMNVIAEHLIPSELVGPIVSLLDSSALDVWVYRGADWYVRDRDAPHVEREAQTVRFSPTVVERYEQLSDGVAKIVGVSDDLAAVAATASQAHERVGDHVSAARSQPYYLDVTHPQANKGSVVRYLSHALEIPPQQIATIGDMPNDVLMFAHSGLSIAMGNADREVQRAARRVTAGNDEEGFALAVERFVLPRARRR